MDPKVCGKQLTTHGEGNDDDDEGRRDGPHPMELRNRLQDGISRIQKVTVVEIVFRWLPRCFRGT